MSLSVTHQNDQAVKSTKRGRGRLEPPIRVNAEEAMNAIAILDDAIKAAKQVRSESCEVIKRFDGLIRTMLRAKERASAAIAKFEREDRAVA